MDFDVVDESEFAAIEQAMAEAAKKIESRAAPVPTHASHTARPGAGAGGRAGGVGRSPYSFPYSAAGHPAPLSSQSMSTSGQVGPGSCSNGIHVPQVQYHQAAMAVSSRPATSSLPGTHGSSTTGGASVCSATGGLPVRPASAPASSADGVGRRTQLNAATLAAFSYEASRRQGVQRGVPPCGTSRSAQHACEGGYASGIGNAGGGAVGGGSQSIPGGERMAGDVTEASETHEAGTRCPPCTVSFTVNSATTFACIGPSHRALVELYRSIPGYSIKAGKHCLPMTEYRTLLEKLKTEHPQVKVEQLPSSVQKAALLKDTDTIPTLDNIPAHLLSSLMPFQREGVVTAIKRQGRLLIGDEMGLGKTLQAIAVSCYYRREWPILVVCPSSMRLTWAEQYYNWVPSLRRADDTVCVLFKGSDDPKGLVNITSYDIASRKAKEFATKRFQIVIADESHYLKNHKAQRTKAVVPLLKKARRALLLTGTPALSRPVELFTQVNALVPELFPSFHAFGVRYCRATRTPFGWDYSGASNLEELNYLLGKSVMIRRQKAVVLNQLPSKLRHKVYVQLTGKHKKMMKNFARKLLDIRKSAVTQSDANFASRQMVLELFLNTGTAKVPAIMEYVKETMATHEDKKMIIFCHHQNVMEALSYQLKGGSIDFIRIDGGTKAKVRQPLVEYFQTKPRCRVACLSITAAGCGLTLTAASIVVFAELYWNPGALLQAEDRAHRIGQRNAINVVYLIAKGTVDEQIWKMISRKLDVVGVALNGTKDVMEVDSEQQSSSNDISGANSDHFIQQILQGLEDNLSRDRSVSKRTSSIVQPEDNSVGEFVGDPREEPQGWSMSSATAVSHGEQERPRTAATPCAGSVDARREVIGTLRRDVSSAPGRVLDIGAGVTVQEPTGSSSVAASAVGAQVGRKRRDGRSTLALFRSKRARTQDDDSTG